MKITSDEKNESKCHFLDYIISPTSTETTTRFNKNQKQKSNLMIQYKIPLCSLKVHLPILILLKRAYEKYSSYFC